MSPAAHSTGSTNGTEKRFFDTDYELDRAALDTDEDLFKPGRRRSLFRRLLPRFLLIAAAIQCLLLMGYQYNKLSSRPVAVTPAGAVTDHPKPSSQPARQKGTADLRAQNDLFNGLKYLKRGDVVLIMKTGALTGNRALQQLSTFARIGSWFTPDNVIVLSDYNFTLISGHHARDVVHVLEDDPKVTESEKWHLYKEQIQVMADTKRDPLSFNDKAKPGGFSGGWQVDGLKFIPGFQQAYQVFPNAKWFLGIDDDTYVNTRNVVRVLDLLDPQKPLYTGAVHYMTANGRNFAHGSFSIYSVGAMRRRFGSNAEGGLGSRAELATYNHAILELCCGDGVMGMAMEDAGVPPNNDFATFFNGEPPENVQLTSDRVCIPLFGFHHIDADRLQILHGQLAPIHEGLTETWLDMYVKLLAADLRQNFEGVSEIEGNLHGSGNNPRRGSILGETDTRGPWAVIRDHLDDKPVVNSWFSDWESESGSDGAADLEWGEHTPSADLCLRTCNYQTINAGNPSKAQISGGCAAWTYLEVNPSTGDPLPKPRCRLSPFAYLRRTMSPEEAKQRSPTNNGVVVRAGLNTQQLEKWQAMCDTENPTTHRRKWQDLVLERRQWLRKEVADNA
ncbi:hypothetical protein PYCC9005_002574 [Savitreella phatthalungensis]